LDLRLVKVNKHPNRLLYHLKDRYGEPERGSEWKPIKILLEGDGNTNKMNTASNTRL
jgi:tRNA uridine 5-carbamoylmethylation protein Kti12